MRIGLLAIVLVGLFIPGFASAQDVRAWPCNDCSNRQMKNVAISKGTGYHYVYSMTDGLIARYEVTREELVPGQLTYFAYLQEPEQWVVDQFAGIHQYYLDNNNSFISAMAASPQSASGGYVNGYDVVGSSQDRNRVSNAIGNSPKMVFTSVMASFGRAIRLSGIATPDVDLTVKVDFPDGSKVIYKFNWNTKQWEYVPKSAVDSHGNNIPETASDFTNNGAGANYDFSGPGNPNDINDFIVRAGLAGVTVTNSAVRLACTQAGDGGYVCHPY